MRVPSGVTDQYIYFVGVDATDLKTRETGLTGFTVYRSRNGAAAAAFTTPTVNETDVTNMPGVYELLLDEDMTIGSGNDSEEMVFHITATGMAPVTRTVELYRPKITVGNTLDVTATGAAGIDWGNIENKTTANDLSGTDIQLVDTCTVNSDQRGTDNALLAANVPANFSSQVITAGGAVDALVQGYVNTLITETTAGRIAGNFDVFFENADVLTTKTVDDVGGAGGSADWTASERNEIRGRLGLTGTTAAGGNTPTLALQSSIDALNDIAATDIVSAGAITTLAGAVVNVDLVDTCTVNSDMLAASSIVSAGAITTLSGAVVNVDLVDTCTTNSDMVGTDNALLASSAPTNFSDMAITITTGQITVGTNNDKAGYSISGAKTTLDALNDIAASSIVSAGAITTLSGAVVNVDLVDTCTTNSDQRGTDNALLAANVPTNFSSQVITAGGAVDSLVQGYVNTLITETTAGRIAGNFDVFFENADALTTQTVDDVGGGGGGSADWTAGEKNEIRGRLGITGTTAAGGNTPTLALEASIAALNDIAATDIVSSGAITTLSGAVVNVDLVDTCTVNSDMLAATSIVSAGAITTLAGAVVNVDLVDTCTVNSDQRGTDNALLAANVPTNFSDMAITLTTGKITVGTNDDKAGYSISGAITTLDGLENITTAQVNAEVDTGLSGFWTSPAVLVDLIWDELIAGHVIAGSFGAKNQKSVPSEVIADYKADTSSLATTAALATVDANVDLILIDTAEIGVAGAGLTNLGGMSIAMKAEINTEADTALSDYDAPTNAEMVVRTVNAVTVAKLEAGGLGSTTGGAITGTLTTTTMTTNLIEATDDHYNGQTVKFTSGALAGQATVITDYTGATKLITMVALTEAPSNGDTFVIL